MRSLCYLQLVEETVGCNHKTLRLEPELNTKNEVTLERARLERHRALLPSTFFPKHKLLDTLSTESDRILCYE